MNPASSRIARLALISFMAGKSLADPLPQPDPALNQGGNETWNADWPGVYGRTYFSLGSIDLVSWEYLPVIDFSDGQKGVGIDLEGTEQLFFRLHYTDTPTTHPELEDFADDGIGSMIKVLMGMNPFEPLAWLDADADGLHDTIEQFWFGNLTSTSGGTNDDEDGNGIRDIFELQTGEDPTIDQTGDPAKRANYQYDDMGRLVMTDMVTYAFDIEGNLESATEPSLPTQVYNKKYLPGDPSLEESPPDEEPPPADSPFPD